MSVVDDPVFRTERARKAGRAAHSTEVLIGRFIARLHELTPAQVEIIRRALPPAVDSNGGSR